MRQRRRTRPIFQLRAGFRWFRRVVPLRGRDSGRKMRRNETKLAVWFLHACKIGRLLPQSAVPLTGGPRVGATLEPLQVPEGDSSKKYLTLVTFSSTESFLVCGLASSHDASWLNFVDENYTEREREQRTGCESCCHPVELLDEAAVEPVRHRLPEPEPADRATLEVVAVEDGEAGAAHVGAISCPQATRPPRPPPRRRPTPFRPPPASG